MLKESAKMPTVNRKIFLDRKIKEGFRVNQQNRTDDEEEVVARIRLAETQLETIQLQGEYLRELFVKDDLSEVKTEAPLKIGEFIQATNELEEEERWREREATVVSRAKRKLSVFGEEEE
eukprot:TRINITY_DN9403_c0_g1_i8.p3 TRINITY_DN9403_c0_g1~~TRINITY_DN9403_c0_g1_i8.p3  ORF type:complete len:120 (-),score=24.09 TRINITY_DN9403_c0_g1_i8:444-803(-)